MMEDKGDDSGIKSKSNLDKPVNLPEAGSSTPQPEDGVSAARKKKDKKKEKKKEEVKKPTTKEDEKRKLAAKRAAKIKKELDSKKEEEEKIKAEEEERERRLEAQRLKEEEEERLKLERKTRKKEKEQAKKEQQKREGTYMTAKQKQKKREALERMGMLNLPSVNKDNIAEVKKTKIVYSKSNKKQVQSKIDDTCKTQEDVTQDTEDIVESESENDWEKLDIEDHSWERNSTSHSVDDSQADNSPQVSSRSGKEHSPVEITPICQAKEPHKVHGESGAVDELEAAVNRIKARREQCDAARSEDNLRCPVVCVLGHVDTGKTKILDKLRSSNVQAGEVGGITQQIGATNVPDVNITAATEMVRDPVCLNIPGLLIIDTPGHESFSNMRSRGSSLCDIAILVVDLMHGIEPQTRESIRLLKERRTPFVVALNKVDLLYQWQRHPEMDIRDSLEQQNKDTKDIYFRDRLNQTIVDFAQECVNVKLFWENDDVKEYVSMIPTSAHSGDGMGNLMNYLCHYAQTHLSKRLSYSEELSATVMEVKEMPGLGTTIDAILVNGRLRTGDTMIISGQEGPIVTPIRSIYMPAPMKELRVKNSYDHFSEVKGAQGVKIIAKDLEKSLAGLPLYVSSDPHEIAFYKVLVQQQLKSILEGIKVKSTGVYVQASTLGSLEALLAFLHQEKIPVMGINIGPIHKKDVTKASVMVEKDPTYACILGFNVPIDHDAADLAKATGVNVFLEEIIYNLQDDFINHLDSIKSEKRERHKDAAIFPVKLRTLPDCIFAKRNPIVVGVRVEAGRLKVGTPLAVVTKKAATEDGTTNSVLIPLGKVGSIEINHKTIDEARKDQEVCIKILPTGNVPREIGTHFDITDVMFSKISRHSIDVLKEFFREDLSKDEWKLVKELKTTLEIL